MAFGTLEPANLQTPVGPAPCSPNLWLRGGRDRPDNGGQPSCGGGAVLMISIAVGEMAVPLSRHRFTVAEYETMGKVGILGEDAWVELVDGEILELSPSGPLHVWAVTLLADHVGAHTREESLLLVQSPI
jgi:hypothetical protein